MRHRKLRRVNRHGGVFDRFAKFVATASGLPVTFGLALLLLVVWAFTGPLFHFSDTWQLVINTGTTIITFLMVFLIQNTQNRDSHAMQLKLDELIRATMGAHTALIDVEELTERELFELKARYLRIAEKGREALRTGNDDTGTPELDPSMEGVD